MSRSLFVRYRDGTSAQFTVDADFDLQKPHAKLAHLSCWNLEDNQLALQLDEIASMYVAEGLTVNSET